MFFVKKNLMISRVMCASGQFWAAPAQHFYPAGQQLQMVGQPFPNISTAGWAAGQHLVNLSIGG